MSVETKRLGVGFTICLEVLHYKVCITALWIFLRPIYIPLTFFPCFLFWSDIHFEIFYCSTSCSEPLFFFPFRRLSHVEKKIWVRLKGEVRFKR